MARAARTWRAVLPALTAAARQQGDAALQIELAKLDALLQQVASAQSLTLAAYLAAVSASHQALALWAANAGSLDPAEQEAWQQADTGAAELTTAADTGFVFSADLSGGGAQTYAEGPPAGDAGAAGDPGGGDGGPGDWGGGPGEAGGGPREVGGDEGTALPGELSAGPAGVGADAGPGAGATADGLPTSMPPGAPGASATAASGWVVFHGGPDASWQPESSPPAELYPRFALQPGDAQDEALSPGEWGTSAGDDAGSDTSSPLEWEEICRPWQPGAGWSVCPGPALPSPGAVEP